MFTTVICLSVAAMIAGAMAFMKFNATRTGKPAEPARARPQPRRRRAKVTAENLEDLIYGMIRRREPGIVIGPPGVGKTYAATHAAERAKRNRLIKTFEIVDGCKDLVADYIQEARLIISETAEGFVRMDPSMIRRHVGDVMRPVEEWSEKDARASWRDDQWLVIIADEITRTSQVFIDSLLPIIANCRVSVEGKSYYAPVLFILVGNQAGIDATTVAFSHALSSRLYQRLTVYQPGPHELAIIYTMPELREEADRLNVPPACRPTDEQALLACGVITLLWGLPLSRKGMACLSQEARRLIREVAAADPELARLLRRYGKLVHFGPDPRKGKRWLISAMHEADREGVTFDLGHLVDTAVTCLAIAGKDTFSEGAESHKWERKEDLIEEIAERALYSDVLRKVMLERPPVEAADPSPAEVAAEIAPCLFVDAARHQDYLRQLLAEHRRQLADDDVADRELRVRATTQFLRRAVHPRPQVAARDLPPMVRGLAAQADGRLLCDDGFLCRPDRTLLEKLRDVGGLTRIGLAIVALLQDEEGQTTFVSIAEEVRLACRVFTGTRAFEPELRDCLAAHVVLRGRAAAAAGLLAPVLASDRDEALLDVVRQLFLEFPVGGPVDARPLFLDLFRAVRKHSRSGYVERFDRLIQLLETPSEITNGIH